MKTKNIRTYNLHILCLVSFLFAFSNAQGLVHCKSHDGHSKIEFAVNNSCSSSNPAISLTKLRLNSIHPYSHSSSSCGPCVDTQIFKKYINTNQNHSQIKSIVSAPPVSLAPIFRSLRFSKYKLSSEFSASVNSCLGSLRTIIILT
ncbi:hypothetical protein L21SP3_02001 [Sedimentisphaera cyanobacteriorum]|uniref:Uncharacterized protein n=1 Tax=Sedimentisphaera cyanobacteriorum TaxID=1940790 RepID=A0A1Q2HSH4_9BACT|nr:hypothetical protein L21SP3_02001 [Sedimentisphaera cyanobacteriorum]